MTPRVNRVELSETPARPQGPIASIGQQGEIDEKGQLGTLVNSAAAKASVNWSAAEFSPRPPGHSTRLPPALEPIALLRFRA
jgi:hypothetical protein